MRLTSFVVATLFVISAGCASAEIAGRATVIDGDTLELRGQRIRLFGIDAPESGQLCQLGGQAYRCGQQAALALADRIGQRTVRCTEKDVDRYGRTVAVCFVGGAALGRWLTLQGWALAYRKYSLEVLARLRRCRGCGTVRRSRPVAGRVPAAVGVAERAPARQSTRPVSAGSIGWYDANAHHLATGYKRLSFETVHAWLLERVPERPGLILDVGAGSGRDAGWLATRGHEVVAVEPSPAMRAEASRRHPVARIRRLEDRLPSLEATFLSSSDRHHEQSPR